MTTFAAQAVPNGVLRYSPATREDPEAWIFEPALASMPHDSRRLADKVEVVDQILRVLGADLAQVKTSVAPVHDDLRRVEAGLAPLPDKLDALLPRVDELAGRLDGMREELAGQLDGLRTDLTGLPFVSKS